MRDDQQETDARQLALAQWIGVEFCGSSKLKPLGHHSSFCVGPPVMDLWYDARLCDLAWWAVGRQIELATDDLTHIIDHAWLAGYRDAAHEPWALVTEPYLDADLAASTVKRTQADVESWCVRVQSLPCAKSSWYPGRCRPIIATIEEGCIRTFFRSAVQWAMEELR